MGRIRSIYLIGSLRNKKIPAFANALEARGFVVFSDWFAPGATADDCWKKYEKARGRTYEQALQGYAARHIFAFDKHHIDRCDAAVLLGPAGKSGHLELGYFIGTKRPGYIVFPKELGSRWDVMLQFATKIFFSEEKFLAAARNGRIG